MNHPSLDLPISTLKSANTIAVVGLSRYAGKEAHDIPVYLANAGYSLVGVNPNAVPEVAGIHVVGSIMEVPNEIDILNVFRPSKDTDAIIEEAILRHQQRGDISCIWLQQDITSLHGAERCAKANITYIEDTCIYVIQQYVNGPGSA